WQEHTNEVSGCRSNRTAGTQMRVHERTTEAQRPQRSERGGRRDRSTERPGCAERPPRTAGHSSLPPLDPLRPPRLLFVPLLSWLIEPERPGTPPQRTLAYAHRVGEAIGGRHAGGGR